MGILRVFFQMEMMWHGASMSALFWKFETEVEIVVTRNLTTVLRSQGSVRAVCPTPPLQRYLSQCTILREKKGGKNNSVTSPRNDSHLPGWFVEAGAASRRPKINVSPLDQWLKTPRYVHVSCTCNHNLPYGFKGNTKSRETWQRAVPAPNREITEDFHQYRLDIAFIFKDTQLPKSRLWSRGEAFRCEEKHKLTLRRGKRGLFLGLLGPSSRSQHQRLLTGRGNHSDIDQDEGYYW